MNLIIINSFILNYSYYNNNIKYSKHIIIKSNGVNWNIVMHQNLYLLI